MEGKLICDVVWQVAIDHVEVRTTEYTRNERQRVGKAYLVYLNIDGFQTNRQPVFTVFENSNLADIFKTLKTEEIDGDKIITAKTIAEALEPGKTEKGEYTASDGTKYTSYGEWLLTLGSKGAMEPRLGSVGFVFGDLPISNGVERFIRMKGGKPQKRADGGGFVISTNASVLTQVKFMKTITGELAWRGMYGTIEASLDKEVQNQVSSGLWKPIPETMLESVQTAGLESIEGTKAEQPGQSEQQSGQENQLPGSAT